MFNVFLGNSNQCYVCTRQDEFEGKCVNTIKTCDPEEDMCLTEYSWQCMIICISVYQY